METNKMPDKDKKGSPSHDDFKNKNADQSQKKSDEKKPQWRSDNKDIPKEGQSEHDAPDEFPNRNPGPRQDPDVQMGRKPDKSSANKAPDSRT